MIDPESLYKEFMTILTSGEDLTPYKDYLDNILLTLIFYYSRTR